MSGGRPPKRGMTWTPWNTDIFEDEKIFELVSSQGWKGFSVYFYLCQKIYGLEGYFIQCATPSFACMTAQKMGGGVGADTVKETILFCLRVGLFDNGLYDRWGILTSRGIQKRFAEVLRTRTDKTVISEYWLLSAEENEKYPWLCFHALNESFLEKNSRFHRKNGSFSSTREEEEKENITTTTTTDVHFTYTDERVCAQEEPKETAEQEESEEPAQLVPPFSYEVSQYFRDEWGLGAYDASIESELFCAWNSTHGWKCLPDWKPYADLWVARKKQKG